MAAACVRTGCRSKATGGGSLNIYLPEEKHWEQFWIDFQRNARLFTGGWNGKAMVIQGKWAGPLVRISYSKGGDGAVRQFGEQSTDDGKSWSPSSTSPTARSKRSPHRGHHRFRSAASSAAAASSANPLRRLAGRPKSREISISGSASGTFTSAMSLPGATRSSAILGGCGITERWNGMGGPGDRA